MNVDGSVTPVEFVVQASSSRTKWVTAVRLLLNGVYLEIDTNDFRRFGSCTAGATPLVNGVEMFADQGGIITHFFASPVQVIGEFLNYADDFTNLKNSISATSDFLELRFKFDTPVVLTEGSTDRLVVKIADDLTDASFTLFNALARGYQELI